MSIKIDIVPIGVVHTKYSDEEVRRSWPEGVDGLVEVFPQYSEGLEGIDGFSHIMLIVWLHKVTNEQRSVLKVRHRRFVRWGVPLGMLPLVGVFCTDSPHRPNPIGISVVKLKERRGRYLYVEGLDLFNGTPVIDIRAVTPELMPAQVLVPKWYKELREVIRKYTGKELIP